MKIIPAIDIMDGKCVRLTRGEFDRRTYYDVSPVDMAKDFDVSGVDLIHVVDLDGARTGRPVNLSTIESICQSVAVPVEVGGGIRTKKDIRRLFNLGVNQVVLGSLVVTCPDLVLTFVQTFGAARIVAGVDILDGVPRISGWTERTILTLEEVLKTLVEVGISTVVATDISRDGMMTAPNVDLYRTLIRQFPELDFVASGGVSCVADVQQLRQAGVEGVIIGKAIYEKILNLPDLC